MKVTRGIKYKTKTKKVKRGGLGWSGPAYERVMKKFNETKKDDWLTKLKYYIWAFFAYDNPSEQNFNTMKMIEKAITDAQDAHEIKVKEQKDAFEEIIKYIDDNKSNVELVKNNNLKFEYTYDTNLNILIKKYNDLILPKKK